MTVDELAVRADRVASAGASWDVGRSTGRLVVAWQHPRSRLIAPVGLLEHDDRRRYRFRYLRRVADVPDFQPLLGFRELDSDYVSSKLFPIFSQRIMSPKRPDFPQYLRQLHLDDGASPWEQMSRSEGRRMGDTLQVFPVPSVDPDGRTTCRFLVHGIRHIEGGRAALSLAPGQRLDLVPEPNNPKNADALLVGAPSGRAVGYVPDLLLEYVRAVASQARVDVVVEHVNGVDAPMHLRLLARLDGTVPPGYQPMSGPGWETFVE